MYYISYTKESLKVGRDSGQRCIRFGTFAAAKRYEEICLKDASRVEYIGFNEDGDKVTVATGTTTFRRDATEVENYKFKQDKISSYAN